MRIKKIQKLDSLVEQIIIELPQVEMMAHVESDFEKTAREVYKRTQNMSDFLFWMSEYARTEEEKVYERIGATASPLTLEEIAKAIKTLKKGKRL